MIIKDLGAVSAYAYAVGKGYTGTEEEFATLMASYATVAEKAAESAESASQSAESASASATTATQKASEATTAAQTATAKAEETQADADAAALDASQALSAASTATSKASEAAQSASDAVTAKTAAQTAQIAAEGSATTAQTAAQTATQKAAEAAESARTLTIDTTLTQSGQAADSKVVGDEIAEVRDTISEQSDEVEYITGNKFYDFDEGKCVSTASSTTTLVKGNESDCDCVIIPCVAGDVFTVSGEGWGNYRLWAFVGAENNSTYPVLSKSASYAVANELVLTAPINSAYFVVNVKNAPNQYKGIVCKGKYVKYFLAEAFKGIEQNALNHLSDSYELGVISEDFSKLQQVCVHHDNFYRTIAGNLWKIGENGNENFPMTYYSLRSDYDTVDDGFRIVDNVLTNDKTVNVVDSIRLATNKPNSKSFMAELGAPSTINGNTIFFVYGAKASDYYKAIRITYVSSSNAYAVFSMQNVGGGLGATTQIATAYGHVDAFRFVVLFDNLYIYADDLCIVNRYAINDLEVTDGIGIGITKNFTVELKFFNLFYFRNFISINPNFAIDSNYFDYPYVSHESVQDTPAYAHTLDDEVVRFSPYSERFELRKTDPYVNGSPRSENVSPGLFRNNLRKMIISFDVLIDSTFESDNIDTIIFQMHDTVDANDNISRSPNIAIALHNGKMRFFVCGWYEKGVAKDATAMPTNFQTVNTNVLTYETDKWYHVELQIKEGYLVEHHPYIVLKIDGETVFKTNAINAYNRVYGAYAKYGIYASDWKTLVSTTTVKTVYVDNFKYSY